MTNETGFKEKRNLFFLFLFSKQASSRSPATRSKCHLILKCNNQSFNGDKQVCQHLWMFSPPTTIWSCHCFAFFEHSENKNQKIDDFVSVSFYPNGRFIFQFLPTPKWTESEWTSERWWKWQKERKKRKN